MVTLPHVAPPPTGADPVVYTGEGAARHIDVEQTIRMMAINIAKIQQPSVGPELNESEISQYEKTIKRTSRWGGWVWGALSVVGFVFTAGVAYSVFLGANATDSEVEAADRRRLLSTMAA